MSIDWIIGIDVVLFVIVVPFLAARAVGLIPIPWLVRLAITGAVPGILLALHLTDHVTGAPVAVVLIAIGWLLGSPWKTLLQGAELLRL